MRKLLKSKKLLAAGTLVAAIAIIGVTYAWFTSGGTFISSPNMARLDIQVTEENQTDPDYHYAPGQTVDLSYLIDNVHAGAKKGLYIDGIVKADFTGGKVEIWSDEHGRQIEPVLYDINKDHLNSVVDVKTVIDDDTWLISAWYVDTTTGIYYNIIDPGMSSEASVSITFKGKEMGNIYNGAVFKFERDFTATTLDEDAVYDVFGLNFDNLAPVGADGEIMSARTKSIDSAGRDYSFYMNLLHDRINK